MEDFYSAQEINVSGRVLFDDILDVVRFESLFELASRHKELHLLFEKYNTIQVGVESKKYNLVSHFTNSSDSHSILRRQWDVAHTLGLFLFICKTKKQ